jgi:bacillithiol synthase
VRISFRGAPGTSPLFLDYLTDWSRLQDYYSTPFSQEAIADFARTRSRLEDSHLDRLCTALTEQQTQLGGSTSGIEKLRRGAVAIVTGQQPGLFTGPLFAFYKAITAIKLARILDEKGILAVPVFWIAAEDHDHEEIRSTFVLDQDSAVRELRVDLIGDAAAPVGWTQYGGDVTAAITQCMAALPRSEFYGEVEDLLRTAYEPGATPVVAFGRMMSRLLASSQMVFVDPLHPVLKELARPTLEAAVRANQDIRSAVLKRSDALIGAGYHAQVKVDQNFTGLFRYNGKARQVLKPADVSSDGVLSPNALLRPVVQDSIFPTAAYVGGPAEIAYFAQSAAAYQVLGRTMPPVVPRISVTLLEPRIKRALQKYRLEVADVFQASDVIRQKAVGAVHDMAAFDRAGAGVATSVDSLRDVLSSVDPTLIPALENSRRKMTYQVERLRTKFVNAETRRNEILRGQLDAICNSLFPDKRLQERVLNVTSFISRYGPGVIGRIESCLDVDPTEHQVVDIQ